MKRFFQRIQEKALDVNQPPVLIVALGDSVTQGVMEHRMLDASAVYHRRLQEELETFFPATTFSTLNAGVSGDNTTLALARLERDVIRHQPDLVLLGFGLNDSLAGVEKLSNFGEALGEIVRRIRGQTEADIVLLTPPFMAKRFSERIHPDHRDVAAKLIQAQTDGTLAAYAEKIREVAQASDLPIADVHAGWERLAASGVDTDLWLVNALNHPDARGHRFAATTIFHVLLCQHPTIGLPS